jgi:alcohol dehydrogenase
MVEKMKDFDYYNPTDIRFGWGRVKEIGEIVALYGNNCLMVTGSGKGLEPLRGIITKLCRDKEVNVIRYNGVSSNPTTVMVNEGTEMAKKNKVDIILGVGGGSPIDVAKAISVGVTHDGDAWDYRVIEGKPIEDKLLPVIAVTTTAGTGTEVTPVSVITNPTIPLKYALADKLLCPKVAIIDPELTVSMPAHITAATGWDAFCHSFESFTSHTSASDYVDLHALEGMRLVIKFLPIAMKDNQNRKARKALHWANTLGGLSISNAGVTLPHGIGMAIGGNASHIHHGEALALMYPEINRWTWKHKIKKYADVGRLFNPALKDEPDDVAAEKACEEMDNFLREIGMWTSFKDKDVPINTLEEIGKDTFKLPDYENHAKVANKDDVMKLLKKSYDR